MFFLCVVHDRLFSFSKMFSRFRHVASFIILFYCQIIFHDMAISHIFIEQLMDI